MEIQTDPDRDFVVRQIRQLVNAIAQLLLGRPASTELDQAEQALLAAAGDALRVDIDLLDRLAPASALKLLASTDQIAAYVGLMEGQLLLARARGDLSGDAHLTRRLGDLRALAGFDPAEPS